MAKDVPGDSDYDPDFDPDTENQSNRSNKPGWRRELEEKAAKGDIASARAETLEYKVLLLEAGINPSSSKAAEYFAKGYDGEKTAEAIKAAAIEAGVLIGTGATGGANAGDQVDSKIQSELDAQNRIAGASAGTAPGVTSTILDEFKGVAWGDIDAVIAIAVKAGSVVDMDVAHTWIDGETKYITQSR